MTEAPVHAVLARALKELGADALFGLMGDSNLFMVDRHVREFGGRYVPAVHESGAVLMALGHASMTGGVGAATVTQGPALSNAATALIEGVKGMIPMVLLAGDTPLADPDHPQAVAQRALVAACGAGFERLRSPETAVVDLAAAFRRARVERRPIVFDMPTEMMWTPAPWTPPPPALPETPARPGEGAALDDLVGLVASARRPLVLAGRGAIHARAALLALAARIGAPVATTLKARGLFRGAPFDLGVFGTLSTPAAAEVIQRTDCVIAFGAGLNRFTTARGGYLEGRRLAQIDSDPSQIGRRVAPDAALVADPALAAEEIVRLLDMAEIPSSRATDDIDPEALRAPPPPPKGAGAPGTVDLEAALDRIDAALPEDRVFVTDGGRFMGAAWTRIGVARPEDMLLSINTGAIGMGMGIAIGAAVARPGRKTLLVTGDGGFMMGGLAEFASAVRERLDLAVVVCNDGAYGAEYVQFEDRQMDPGLSTFDWPSMAAMAEAMGARAARVASEAELDRAAETLAAEGPALIELVLDPAAVPRLQL